MKTKHSGQVHGRKQNLFSSVNKDGLKMHFIIGDSELHNIEFDKRWKSPEEKNIRHVAATEVNISLTDSCWENQGINTLAVTTYSN